MMMVMMWCQYGDNKQYELAAADNNQHAYYIIDDDDND